MLRTTMKSICLALGLTVLLLCGAETSRADITDAETTGRPATAAELGFSGSKAEIRSQAAEIAPPGSWDPKSWEEFPQLMALAKDPPLVQTDSLTARRLEEFRFEAPIPRERVRPGADDATAMGLAAEEDIVGWEAGSHIPMGDHHQPVNCRTSGRRIKLVYAYPRDYTPTEEWEGLLPWQAIGRANFKIALEALRSSELERGALLNVDCYPPGHILAGYPTISPIEINDPDPESDVIGRALDAHFGRPSGANALRFLVFFSQQDPEDRYNGWAGGVGGAASGWRSTEAANLWNQKTVFATIYRASWMNHTVIHELLHTFGAVHNGPPLNWVGTGGSHCTIALDIMCYRDKGEFGHLYPAGTFCPDDDPDDVAIDCLKSVYFRADHGDGSPLDYWLDLRWNTIGAENRFVTSVPPWDYTVPCDTC